MLRQNPLAIKTIKLNDSSFHVQVHFKLQSTKRVFLQDKHRIYLVLIRSMVAFRSAVAVKRAQCCVN